MHLKKRYEMHCCHPCLVLKGSVFISARGVNPRRIGRVGQMVLKGEDKKNKNNKKIWVEEIRTKLHGESQLYCGERGYF